jgi:hypothetical protein
MRKRRMLMGKRKMMIVVMLLRAFYHKIDKILEEVKGRKIQPYAEKTAMLEEAFTTLLPMVQWAVYGEVPERKTIP